MNRVNLIGNICTEVDARITPNGTHVTTYRLAVGRRFKKEGQPEADFLSCVVWGKGAEFAEKYFRKGMKVAVSGSIQTRSYDDKDGKKVYITEIVVDEQEFCEKKSDAPATQSAPVTSEIPTAQYVDIDPNMDDLPF